METGSAIFWIMRVALCSFAGYSRKDAIEIQANKSYEELESQLKIEDWAIFIVKMFNKHFLKENLLSTDLKGKRDFMSYFKASDKLYENFPGYMVSNDDFYFTLMEAIKEFHDTKVYNNKLNIKEDPRSYRPIATKKFDELTYEEFLRDLCLFEAMQNEYSWLLGGFGKYDESAFGKIKGTPQVENAFAAYKNGGKEMSIEQICEKYQHMNRFDAEKLGVYVEASVLGDSVEKHTTGSLFEHSKSMYFPATIGGKPLAILKGGNLIDSVEKVYLLGDVERIESYFLDNCNIKEVIALGKIGYISGSAFNGYKSTPENGIIYIKVNGNPHYFAANIRSESIKNITLPNDTKEVCGGFVSLCPLETINLGSIIKIHDGAFSGADRLKEIVLPDTLEELGAYSFKQSAISKLTIGNKLKVIKEDTFQQCDNLKEVYIPENVEVIKNGAFTYCENLKNVKVHVDTLIEENAFDEQVKIERYGVSKKKVEVKPQPVKNNVVKPQQVKKELKTLTVTGNVFKNQYNDESDYEAIHFIGKNILIEESFEKFKKLKQITVDGNIALIDDLFGDSKEIFTITGDFNQSTLIYYIKINDNPHYVLHMDLNSNVKVHDDCKVIGQRALQSAKSIDFANVEFISAYACKNNKRLKSIKMSQKLKIIDREAFKYTGLTEVKLPKSLRFIGEEAFYDCEDLKVIFVPKTCKVAKNAFPETCKVVYY